MTIEDTLAAWLPAQRWYAGSPAATRDLAITADTILAAGDPALRHLIIALRQAGQTVRYQVLVGVRSRLPDRLRHAAIGPADGGVAYDALHDPVLTRMILHSLADQRVVGPLRFVREPGAVIDTAPDSTVLTAEQSNTSLIFGDFAILKVVRKLFPGCNPDLEVARALASRGSRHVAEPFGWIGTRMGSEPVLLAVLSRYLPAAVDGWALAAESLRAAFGDVADAGGAELMTAAPSSGAHPAGPDFADDAYLLGVATAEVHADLAAAFGTGQLGPAAVAELAGQMTRRLERASAEVPELRRHEQKVRACYASLADSGTPLPVQRVHGDFHLGQVLRTKDSWVALDFEGEPITPLAQRRGLAPALRDVAGMLRSFDYAARHLLLGHPDQDRLRHAGAEWVGRSQAAFCEGYAQAGGMDPRANAVLLRALLLDKAVYEVVYEATHRPTWLQIPLDSIAETLWAPQRPTWSATMRSTGSSAARITTRTPSSARTRVRPA
jgi:maltokinase